MNTYDIGRYKTQNHQHMNPCMFLHSCKIIVIIVVNDFDLVLGIIVLD